jgi:hypothetical protein
VAEESYPFDTSGVTTPSMGEDLWRRYARVFTPDGVHGGAGSTSLAVSVNANSISVDIAVGFAAVQGSLYNNTATMNKTNTANGGGSARPDRVILRYDQTANSIIAVVREGTVGGAAPPTLTQAVTGQWEIPLARWSRAAGGSIGSLVDERQFLDRSGVLWMPESAITAAVPLTALVPSPWVGMRVATTAATISGKEWRWTGAFWERMDPGPLLTVVDTTASAPTTTAWAVLAGPSGTFTAPMSGRVKVHIGALVTSPASAGDCGYTARVTGPGGVDSTPATDSPDQCSFGGGSGDARLKSSEAFYVAGLTAGSVYTATGLGRVTTPSGHQRIENKRIIVERA